MLIALPSSYSGHGIPVTCWQTTATHVVAIFYIPKSSLFGVGFHRLLTVCNYHHICTYLEETGHVRQSYGRSKALGTVMTMNIQEEQQRLFVGIALTKARFSEYLGAVSFVENHNV